MNIPPNSTVKNVQLFLQGAPEDLADIKQNCSLRVLLSGRVIAYLKLDTAATEVHSLSEIDQLAGAVIAQLFEVEPSHGPITVWTVPVTYFATAGGDLNAGLTRRDESKVLSAPLTITMKFELLAEVDSITPIFSRPRPNVLN